MGPRGLVHEGPHAETLTAPLATRAQHMKVWALLMALGSSWPAPLACAAIWSRLSWEMQTPGFTAVCPETAFLQVYVAEQRQQGAGQARLPGSVPNSAQGCAGSPLAAPSSPLLHPQVPEGAPG